MWYKKHLNVKLCWSCNLFSVFTFRTIEKKPLLIVESRIQKQASQDSLFFIGGEKSNQLHYVSLAKNCKQKLK